MTRLRGWLFLPDTLVGRASAVLVGGLLLSQVTALVLFSFNRTDLASRLDSRHMADQMVSAVRLIEQTPGVDERHLLTKSMSRADFRLGWGPIPLVTPRMSANNNDAELRQELNRRLPDHVVRVVYRPNGGDALVLLPTQEEAPPAPQARTPAAIRDAETGMVYSRLASNIISVSLSDGTWLNANLTEAPQEPLWRWRFLVPLAGGNLVVFLLSILAVRLGVKPLKLLSAAAERLGRDVGAPPLAVIGPQEVQTAATAFNRMQVRLRRFVDDRTQMVAAISHDLRTPITRLKLRAEFVDDDEQRVKMLSDLDEMESMISSTLAFAREDATREQRQQLDIVPLLEDLCEHFEASYEGPDHLVLTAGLTGMKRVFANLIENAKKYAGGARVSVSGGTDRVIVTVDDDGPGVPSDQLEKVFTAFYRVENSRNRETGGTGLGLTVARSVVRAHGGDVILSNRSSGGLRATVSLPV